MKLGISKYFGDPRGNGFSVNFRAIFGLPRERVFTDEILFSSRESAKKRVEIKLIEFFDFFDDACYYGDVPISKKLIKNFKLL